MGRSIVAGIVIAVTSFALSACGREELPESSAPSEPAASPPAKQVAAEPAVAKAPAASAEENDYQTVRARTMKGEETDVQIKAPSGWKVMAAPTSPDPHGGKFTLVEATRGLPKKGRLSARIETAPGSFYCDLYEAEVPNTVANFVGLARGLRKYWDPEALAWVGKPYYDGTVFHRTRPGFVIQGGDRTGTGMGLVGYFIPDELHPSLSHDRPAQLCMANRAKNANGAQIMITEVPSPHLDGGYTVFGQCEPATLVQRISRMPQSKEGKPHAPVVVKKVEIKRVVGGAAAWRPDGDVIPPIPGLPAPGRAVRVEPEQPPTNP
jgi:peptidyl-prolyl cis-trans isomerase A (cyclophilin A)